MQKSFLSFSENFSDNIFKGMVEVLEETMEPSFFDLKIFSYI